MLVQAANLNEAYDKAVEIARQHTAPYEWGPDRVGVQWVFEGITALLPIYEELKDGGDHVG